MRFTSTRDFMTFLETLGEAGFKAPSPYFLIEKRVNSLPDYISRYGVSIAYSEVPRERVDFHGERHREVIWREVHVILTRNKATAMDLNLVNNG